MERLFRLGYVAKGAVYAIVRVAGGFGSIWARWQNDWYTGRFAIAPIPLQALLIRSLTLSLWNVESRLYRLIRLTSPGYFVEPGAGKKRFSTQS
ncbi:hypothetical protein [Allocoleopsis franciscana]|uniref:Uncharacterized protein n=1 Tax=Allocoleopsis franciscana PCC 7113 TaxID=1173027 RepID=K9WND8_9CYAN|nr:hypothetical protein [Allocoleopsis franciscana]AFZ21693.1 hypothetical protein Mic7113_6097 [Allocoleopsis franciscana PCC 7113]